jgi:hypothetical protein
MNIYTNIATGATNIINTRPCVLEKVTVNKAVAAGTISIYDNSATGLTGGSTVAVITCPNPLLQNHFTLNYGVCLKKGLSVRTTGAGINVTFVHRPAA